MDSSVDTVIQRVQLGSRQTVICDGGSILGVQFFAKNFPLIWSVGTSLARKTYESPTLSPNNSEIWEATAVIFSSATHLCPV